MIRVLLVDDSPSARHVLEQRLSERGYEVTSAADGVAAAELALSQPPDFVVTDLWMPGVSGVQLCRLLRAEPRTAHVPIILITGESQRRSRFWARTAGAADYVAKNDPARLFDTLERLAAEFPANPPEVAYAASRTPVQHRIFQRLDAALFESVVAGEVRALAHAEGEADSVFRGLAKFASEVAAYRWLAVQFRAPSRLFVHSDPSECVAAEAEARAALNVGPEVEAVRVTDDRAGTGRPTPPLVAEVRGGGRGIGAVALGPSPRGASSEDRQLVSIFAAELGGPLRIVALVEQARHLAMSDPLTGLLNRRAGMDVLLRSFASFERHGHPLAIMLLDIDHFKRVNDTHGHESGDAVLSGVADVLRAMARRTDFVVRWGGEEFVVVLGNTGLPAAAIPAERLRKALMEHQFHLPDGGDLQITGSIGIAAALKGERIDALIARADQAMYLAKSRGRNRCVIHEANAVVPPLAAVSPSTPAKDAAV